MGKTRSKHTPSFLLNFEIVNRQFPAGPVNEISADVYMSEVYEAEDSSKPGGTSYGITVTINSARWDGDVFSQVIVDLQMVFKVYDSDAYTSN